MYTIGQISEMTGLSISTLRYYDQQGLLGQVERVSGIRQFGDRELEVLRMIECLKKSGLEIKDIKQYMDWCTEGPSTFPQRQEMFQKQRKAVEQEIAHLNRVLDMLKFKCWYYDRAISEGTDERIRALLPDHLPEEIQQVYNHAHDEKMEYSNMSI